MTKRTSGIDRYSTFGLREVWLEEFFTYGDEWLENNSHKLENIIKQVEEILTKNEIISYYSGLQ